jgi:DNA invertase Pin-like site-specific DNA recombinase
MKLQHGFDDVTVRKYYPEYKGAPQRRGGRLLSEYEPEKYAQMKQLVEDGVSVEEIVRTLHVSHHTVTKYFPDAPWDLHGEEYRIFKKSTYLKKSLNL